MHIQEKTTRIAREVRKQTATSLLAALGLIVGLAWNDAVRSLFELLVPLGKDTVIVQFLYAAGLTLFLVFMTVLFLHATRRRD